MSMQVNAATWSNRSRAALAATSAVLCLLLGALLGVRAAGGHPQDVLTPFNHPVHPTSHRPTAVHAQTITQTVTVTVKQPRRDGHHRGNGGHRHRHKPGDQQGDSGD